MVALLGAGDCTLYDSRMLHCGGPHREPHEAQGAASLALPTERVLFYVSFKHALASTAELANADVHGAGSILPSVAQMRLLLGALRGRVA